VVGDEAVVEACIHSWETTSKVVALSHMRSNKRLELTKRDLLVGGPALACRRRPSSSSRASQLKRGVLQSLL
jgi:hypothetical protein